jgi:hypothetical protein
MVRFFKKWKEYVMMRSIGNNNLVIIKKIIGIMLSGSRWTKVSIIVNLLMTTFTAIIAIFAIYSFNSQKKYYEETVRPIVGITTKFEPDPGDSTKSTYNIMNYGNSPAINVQSATRAYLTDDPLFVIKEFNPKGAFTNLFPKDFNNVSTRIIKKHREKQFLNICVFYSDNKGNNYWSTTIFYMKFTNDDQAEIIPVKSVISDYIPKNMVIIYESLNKKGSKQ